MYSLWSGTAGHLTSLQPGSTPHAQPALPLVCFVVLVIVFTVSDVKVLERDVT